MIRLTSLIAYSELVENGTIGKTQEIVLDILEEHGAMTGSELNELGQRPGLHKRLSELKRMSLVAEAHIRKCSVTGRNALTWKIVDPKPLQEKPKKEKTKRRWWLVIPNNGEYPLIFENKAAAKLNAELNEFEFIEVKEVIRK